MSDWRIYQGSRQPHDGINRLPAPPPWRSFSDIRSKHATFQVEDKEIELVNAALYLRRPLLITGQPGTGKSSLAYAVAHELKLDSVLVWPITSHSNLQDALYRYDSIGRLQDANLYKGKAKEADPRRIGLFIRLGPLGTAMLPSERPRVLLIDEIDKSDIDLPNDLLHIFEDGRYEIPELARLADTAPDVPVFKHESEEKVTIQHGRVPCTQFPFVVITSNGERELPPAFYRRCIRLDINEPDTDKLARIVEAHFDVKLEKNELIRKLRNDFIQRREHGYIATDQLLNAIYLLKQGADLQKLLNNISEEEKMAAAIASKESGELTDDNNTSGEKQRKLIDVILRSLSAQENR